MKAISLLCTAGILALSSSAAFADVKPADRAQIKKAYQTAVAALNKKDVDAAVKVMTDDFTSTENGTSQTKAEMVKQMKQHLATAQNFHAKFAPGKMTQAGDKVKVMCTYTFSGTVMDPKTKKTHHMSSVGTSVDTWVKQGNMWMLQNITTKTDKTLIDGKRPKTGRA